ncbi:MAG TPA: CHASE3 domain-containing protein [Gemmatimonadales bacterium]|jgi:signal transduction histidine kinase
MPDLIERRLILAFAIALLVLIGGAWASIRSSHLLASNEARVSQSLELLNALETVLSDITDAETGQRGYLITGRPEYLEPFNRAPGLLRPTLDRLTVLTAGDPAQSRRLVQLKADVAVKIGELTRTVATRRDRGFSAAQEMVLTERGHTTMDEIRRSIAEMEASESALLGRRAAESAATASSTTFRLMVASLLVGAALINFFTIGVRGLAQRRRYVADISRQRAAAEAASRAKDDFLAIASHELRTPLMSMGLQIQIVRRSIEDQLKDARQTSAAVTADGLDRLLTLTQVVDRDSRRLGDLVNGLLDVTRIASGQFRVEPGTAELGEIVTAAVATARPDPRRGPAISIHIAGPLVGGWDRVRLEQVVVNLVSNAIRYGGGQPIRIDGRGEDDGVVLTVTDSGPGIDPDLLPRLFRRFERGTASSRGLGLGLYISRRIVEAHGGAISAKSRPGEGATFTIHLPRQAPAIPPDQVI